MYFFFSIRLNHHVALKVAFLGFLSMWENELVVHQKMIWQAYYDKKKKDLPTVQKTAMLAFSNEPIFIYTLQFSIHSRWQNFLINTLLFHNCCWVQIKGEVRDGPTMYDFHNSTDTLKFWTEKWTINKTFLFFIWFWWNLVKLSMCTTISPSFIKIGWKTKKFY